VRVFDVEIWLIAVPGEVPEDELRAHWRGWETPALDRVLAASPRFRLGATEVVYPGNEDLRGPVGRVQDLIYLRGTTPDYVLPLLDSQLERELLDAYGPRLGDPPFNVASPAELEAFLASNRGARLATESPPLPGF